MNDDEAGEEEQHRSRPFPPARLLVSVAPRANATTTTTAAATAAKSSAVKRKPPSWTCGAHTEASRIAAVATTSEIATASPAPDRTECMTIAAPGDPK